MYFKSLEDLSSINIDDLKTDHNIILVLGTDGDRELCHGVCSILKEHEVPFLGGLFPSVIHNFECHEKGVVLSRLHSSMKPLLFQNIDAKNLEKVVKEQIPEDLPRGLTCLTLVDGLSQGTSSFLDALYSNVGPSAKYLGGGAGSLSLKPSPCIMTNEGLFQDAAVILFVEDRWELGARHGWTPVTDELVVTEVEDNIVKKINWRPAGDVYKELVEPLCKSEITQDNFFDQAKSFPFGIQKTEEEWIVRDPIVLNDDNSLVCVGDIQKGAVVRILNGDVERLCQAVGEAVHSFVKNEPKDPKQVFIVDCISRVIFMNDKFQEELDTVSQAFNESQSIDNFGVLSLGEIASSHDGLLEFYAKTFVVGANYE